MFFVSEQMDLDITHHIYEFAARALPILPTVRDDGKQSVICGIKIDRFAARARVALRDR